MELIDNLHSIRYLQTRLVFCIDMTVSVLSSLAVLFLLTLILHHFPFEEGFMSIWLIGAAVASLAMFRAGRVYRYIIRYSSLRELSRLSAVTFGKEVLLGVAVACLTRFTPASNMFWGLLLLDFFVTLCALTLVRMAMVTGYDLLRTYNQRRREIKRVLVFGTNDKSVSVAIRLRNSPHYEVTGFLSRDASLDGHRLQGLPVTCVNSPGGLQEARLKGDADGILFAYTSDARAEKDGLIALCRKDGLRVYLAPGIDEVKEGEIPGLVRKIKIEDLLGRSEIKLSMDEIIRNFKDKTVMVTGAAGSIGSELCRQLSTFGIRRLVLFDNAESPLHAIRLELEDRFPDLRLTPVIGDVRSIPRLDYVFRKFRPDVLFHAAAYKHVPLMEENPCEAVRVNVVGTRNVADKCVEYGVGKMVMVSTDKAVNPTNIMGCSKRLAEIYVQSLGLALDSGTVKGATKFVTTRFGNVLGSNGSVIPRFSEQIAKGGPVTVTHPDIRRYFMTIPEACRLVMEAATMTSGNQIFVFDMGEPVKIADLATQMIHLAGLVPGRDIEIKYTGLRPGEKLYEEVLATKENTIPTEHSRIFVAKVRKYDYDMAREVVERLERLSTDVQIPDMVKLMKQTVPEYISHNSMFEKYDHKDNGPASTDTNPPT